MCLHLKRSLAYKNQASKTYSAFLIYFKAAWQVVGFFFLFLLKNNRTENSCRKVWHLFNSYLNLVNSRLGHWMQCQGQKVRWAEFCTCPREVIKEPLEMRGIGGNVLVCSQGTFPLLFMGL